MSVNQDFYFTFILKKERHRSCFWMLVGRELTLKRQSRLQQTTFINIFHCFSAKIRLDVSSESSARQRIHMKNQALFSLKDKSKKLKCHLLQFLFGALRVKSFFKFVSSTCIANTNIVTLSKQMIHIGPNKTICVVQVTA